MTRPTLAVWKFSSCDGCQLSLLDCEDELLAIAEGLRIAYFPEATSGEVEGPYDVSLEYFKPAAMVMALKPSVAPALRLAGFQSVQDALESQLGLKLVPTTTQVPAIAIDEIQRPLPGPPGR